MDMGVRSIHSILTHHACADDAASRHALHTWVALIHSDIGVNDKSNWIRTPASASGRPQLANDGDDADNGDDADEAHELGEDTNASSAHAAP